MTLIQIYWQHYLWSDGFRFTGLVITLWLLLASGVCSLLLAIPLAFARASSNRLLSTPVWLFTILLRGTPCYLLLLLIYTGLASLECVRNSALWLFFSDAFNCAITALALCSCAYCTEIFAGAIRATSSGEVEAAHAIGFSPLARLCHIVLPSALRRVLPAYSNEIIYLLHATSLSLSITVPDLLYVASYVNATTFRTFEAYGIVALLYLLITLGLVQLFKRIERRYLAHLRPPGHSSPTPR